MSNSVAVKPDLSIHTGRYFPKPIIILGYIGMAIGILCLFGSIVIGLIIIIISSYFSFNVGGFEIQNGKYRMFYYFLHFKIGKWKSNDFHNITMLMNNYVTRTYGGRAPVSVAESEIIYEITLLSETHLTKVILLYLNDFDKAKLLLKKVSDLLDVDIVKYKPQVSSRKKRRR